MGHKQWRVHYIEDLTEIMMGIDSESNVLFVVV